MSVSRRGFLQGLGVGRTAHASAFMAARGHEEYVAEAIEPQGGQGGRPMRPNLPPGVEAIRISSNENPLGPGKAAIDAILGKFPEANRYPFNSTPLDADLEILIARQNSAKRENVVLTPHLGFVNDPVFAKFGPGVVENLMNWLEGRPLVRLVKS